ncbi:TPA: tape measure protein [Streptococcus agalactiae]
MADGKLTIQVDLDGSRAQQGVGRLKGLLQSLGSASSSSFGSGRRSALGFGAAMGVATALVQKGIGLVNSSIGGAVSRVDTMNKFPKMMESWGYSTKQSKSAIDALAKGIDGLPTALDEVVGTTQQLTLMNGDLSKSTKLALALNDAFLASGSSAGDASRGLTQFTQMMSSGKVDMQSWKSLMETMPVGLQKTAEAFGFAGASAKQDLYKALQDGTITFDQFSDKLIELDGGLNGFAELARKTQMVSEQVLKMLELP